MVREIETLAVKDIPWYEQPLITIPLIGDIPPRKLIYMVLMGLILLAPFRLLGLGTEYQIAASLAGLGLGFYVAKPTKSVSIERILLTVITGSYKPRTFKKVKVKIKEIREEQVELRVQRLEPVKITGLLIDPYSGYIISGTEVELYVDGRLVDKVVTDSQGAYSFYVQLQPGIHIVEVKYGNAVLTRKKVHVMVERES